MAEMDPSSAEYAKGQSLIQNCERLAADAKESNSGAAETMTEKKMADENNRKEEADEGAQEKKSVLERWASSAHLFDVTVPASGPGNKQQEKRSNKRRRWTRGHKRRSPAPRDRRGSMQDIRHQRSTQKI